MVQCFNLALKSNGTVWACGNNEYGQIGLGNTNNVSAPVQIPGLSNIIAISAGPFHSLFLKSDSTVLACGINAEGQLGFGNPALTSFNSSSNYWLK
ncbi:MAG: hypothetical protein IPL10_03555 [Bacteroidetes bacterium]|nr:hypothetical protein [Bacteroidota bacterium]